MAAWWAPKSLQSLQKRPDSYAKGFIARQYRCAKKPLQLGYSAQAFTGATPLMNTFQDSVLTAFSLITTLDPVLAGIVLRSLAVSACACVLACSLGLVLGAWLGVARARLRSEASTPRRRPCSVNENPRMWLELDTV